MLQFAKRPKRDETDVADRSIWLSKCKQYRIVRSVYLFGKIPDTWYAAHYDAATGVWDTISRHRRKSAALKACEKHARSRQ